MLILTRLPRSKRLRIKNLRIGVPVQYHHELMSKEVLDTWNEVAHMLADGQAIIKHVSVISFSTNGKFNNKTCYCRYLCLKLKMPFLATVL